MFIERIILSNFRCFGPEPHSIDLSSGLTAFIGVNGAGKTAVMQALQRLFGVTSEQRRLRRQDFHIPIAEVAPVREQNLAIEVIVAFPELDMGDVDDSVIPEFFQHMVADEGGKLKCRLRLEATWIDDGSLDGAIEQKFWAVRRFGSFNSESDCTELKAIDRARIQMIYVPAVRDGFSQVSSFLRGRLWRAVNWSQGVREVFLASGATLNGAFRDEAAVNLVTTAVTNRWREMHSAGTDTTPRFRPVDLRFEEFIRKVEVAFYPDEAGRERGLDDLSDGQRSLFHLAMTAAALDVEAQIAIDSAIVGFLPDGVPLPALTLIAVEEPENNLAPFYLSRIIRQIENLVDGARAQALVSSHSASILARIDPTQVRHFRLNPVDRTAKVRSIRLPEGEEEAAKFVREAVRTYPELYFARFVVLGEGASEEVVLPRLAEAINFAIDRSFVAVVPLGGRHVNHLWRLLSGLEIPYATLLDLDWGRAGGGWGRIKNICSQLLANGVNSQTLLRCDPAEVETNLTLFDAAPAEDKESLYSWARALRSFDVFFCAPLDLDYSMLCAFPDAYQTIEPGLQGPSSSGDPRTSVLKDNGRPEFYGPDQDQALRWYRYLFLGRGKPSTHVRVLSGLTAADLASGAPEELRSLLSTIIGRLEPEPGDLIGA